MREDIIQALLHKTNITVFIFYLEGNFSGFCIDIENLNNPKEYDIKSILQVCPPSIENIGDYSLKYAKSITYKYPFGDLGARRDKYSFYKNLKNIQLCN